MFTSNTLCTYELAIQIMVSPFWDLHKVECACGEAFQSSYARRQDAMHDIPSRMSTLASDIRWPFIIDTLTIEYVLTQVIMMRKVLAAMLAETAAIVTRTDHVNAIVSVDAKDSVALTTAKVSVCEMAQAHVYQRRNALCHSLGRIPIGVLAPVGGARLEGGI